MPVRHFYIDFFIKVYIYEGVSYVVLLYLKVKSCYKGNNRPKASSYKRSNVNIFVY
jgi:hypothetical protein